jgi:hypothetical protein
MTILGVVFSVAVLLALLAVVVRRAIVQDFRTARHGGMSSTSPDRRRPSARLRLLARDCPENGTSLCQAAGDREENNLLNLDGVRGLQP